MYHTLNNNMNGILILQILFFLLLSLINKEICHFTRVFFVITYICKRMCKCMNPALSYLLILQCISPALSYLFILQCISPALSYLILPVSELSLLSYRLILQINVSYLIMPSYLANKCVLPYHTFLSCQCM